MMKFFIPLLLTSAWLLSEASALSVASRRDALWEDFKAKYGRNYPPEEEPQRRQTFENNLDHIESHNSEAKKGKHTHTLSVNQFTDMTFEEFNSIYNGAKPPPASQYDAYNRLNQEKRSSPLSVSAPASLDWRNTPGYVTSVKNQGQCGDCWVFSAVASLEGAWFAATGQSRNLSEQQVVDCYGGNACDGGWQTDAYTYMKNGVMSYEAYPYSQNTYYYQISGTCAYKPSAAVAYDTGSYITTTSHTEAELLTMLQSGPVAVAINVTNNFQHYNSGVFKDSLCLNQPWSTWSKQLSPVNHAVLVVGYGTDSSNNAYWIVKNSWGASWGENGYLRMSRNVGGVGLCGIAAYPYIPTVSTSSSTTTSKASTTTSTSTRSTTTSRCQG